MESERQMDLTKTELWLTLAAMIILGASKFLGLSPEVMKMIVALAVAYTGGRSIAKLRGPK